MQKFISWSSWQSGKGVTVKHCSLDNTLPSFFRLALSLVWHLVVSFRAAPNLVGRQCISFIISIFCVEYICTVWTASFCLLCPNSRLRRMLELTTKMSDTKYASQFEFYWEVCTTSIKPCLWLDIINPQSSHLSLSLYKEIEISRIKLSHKANLDSLSQEWHKSTLQCIW